MGLKYVHFGFIVLAAICTLSFGLWAVFTGQDVVGVWGRLGGAASALLGFSLIGYAAWFLRKTRSLP